jgi:hypothetical protein
MEESKPVHRRQHEQAIEEAYRRGYHHGLSRARDLLLRLMNEGMPAMAALELCRVFEEQLILPWRLHAASSSSAPPLFDGEACQRLLREDKQRQSQRPPGSSSGPCPERRSANIQPCWLFLPHSFPAIAAKGWWERTRYQLDGTPPPVGCSHICSCFRQPTGSRGAARP